MGSSLVHLFSCSIHLSYLVGDFPWALHVVTVDKVYGRYREGQLFVTFFNREKIYSKFEQSSPNILLEIRHDAYFPVVDS